ncbi:MAG TPA: hypothetical protein G4N96_09515 [Chloroflexi bacterium]|nr:hypothetical protein [Chloroflexota bacterium]
MSKKSKRLSIEHLGLLAVLLAYLILSLNYNFASPIFEPPDESTHYRYVKYLLDHKTLPAIIDGPNRNELWGLHQPPLYFLVSAAIFSPFDFPAPDDALARNPHVNLGVATIPGNKNVFIHTPAESFPWRGLPLTVHAMRLLSTLFGAATLAVVYVMGFEVFVGEQGSRGAGGQVSRGESEQGGKDSVGASARPHTGTPAHFPTRTPAHLLPIIAPALMVLHPEFVFITSAIHNESLNILLMALGLWGALRLVNRGPSVKLAIFLGIVSGLIALAKMTGLALILLIVLAMLIAAVKEAFSFQRSAVGRRPSAVSGHSPFTIHHLPFTICLFLFGVIVAGLTALIGGWWYLFNWQLYGDPFQSGMYRNFYSDIQRTITFRDLFNGIRLGEVSFWAVFGWFNLLVPEWMYTFYKVFARVAGVGVVVYFVQVSRWAGGKVSRWENTHLPPCPPAHLLLLLASPLLSSLVLTRLIATEGGIQGRQLLPMLPALVLLVVIGYRQLLPGKSFDVTAALVGSFMATMAFSIPLLYIAPTYAPPPIVQQAELAEATGFVPLHRFYGDEIELLGYRLDAEEVVSGRGTGLSLYWRALKPVDKNYTLFVHALGRKGKKVGQYNGYPGSGNFPTTLWQPGQLYADHVSLVIDPSAETPTLLRLHVGFFDFNRPDLPPLPTTDEAGEPVSAFVAQQALLPEPNEPVEIYECTFFPVDFADHIRLTCYDFDDDRLRLHWYVDAPPSQDYTVFIQLWQNGQQIAGFDGPPLEGDFPASYWRPGIQVVDIHPLDLKQLDPGAYRLLAGLYNPQTGERLSARALSGEALPDNALDLGEIILR